MVTDQSTDYYPYGLAHGHENLNLNRHLFSGKELQDQIIDSELLGLYDFGSYKSLGGILHMIQDAYSPAHSLKNWDGKTISYLPHIFEGRLFNRPEFKDAQEATKYIYLQVKNCESNDEAIADIFSDWKLIVPQNLRKYHKK